jgi:hypothetical protein
MPCECGKIYIGQTKSSIKTRIKERHRHIRLYHPDKSAVAEHSIHSIQFQDTKIMATETGRMERIIREATEIEIHPHDRTGKKVSP